MLRRTYVKPQMEVEKFSPNSYVAACGDTEYGQYKFECNAGGGTYGALWVVTNSSYSWDSSHPVQYYAGKYYKRMSSGSATYHACGIAHESPTTDDYLEGYFDANDNLKDGAQQEKVLIWFSDGSYTGHATNKLNRDSWTVTKS